MLVVVSYDVSTKEPAGQRRLRRVARACEDYGQRVQNSVFECIVDPAHWEALKLRLLDEIDSSKDSLRFYFLGSSFEQKIEHHGAKGVPDLRGPLVL
ncbi:MAG: CRISPR-associated endonuclease Cas2 [Planctomycetes bacterium]|nr:CRISPR-associated endonuclease Cas2 [Planctomycetota bacterium]